MLFRLRHSKCVLLGVALVCFSLQSQHVFLFSIPKCGTHLILKCLQQLTGRKQFPIAGFTQLHIADYVKAGDAILKGHTICNDRNIQIFHAKDSLGFLIVRDPRDQVVSMMHWINKHKKIWSKYIQSSEREILIDLIIDGKNVYSVQFDGPEVHHLAGITSFYDLFLPWAGEPNVLLIKFEDLVGAKGGGTQEAQLKAVADIARHLDKDFSEIKVQSVANALFGNSYTFQKGQIGRWREYFDDDLKNLFKQYGGKLLIELGYEEDFNW